MSSYTPSAAAITTTGTIRIIRAAIRKLLRQHSSSMQEADFADLEQDCILIVLRALRSNLYPAGAYSTLCWSVVRNQLKQFWESQRTRPSTIPSLDLDERQWPDDVEDPLDVVKRYRTGDARLDRTLCAIALSDSISQAAARLGCSRTTVYSHLARIRAYHEENEPLWGLYTLIGSALSDCLNT